MPNGCRTRSVTANPPRATSGSTSPISKPSATAMLSSPRREADVSVIRGTLSFAFMATLDQLSDEQRAIIELILQRGQSYDQLADSLGMPESRVRELAREALVRLAPITARLVEQDWRGQLADYMLGQQSGPESTATRGHLRRPGAARSLAPALLDPPDGLLRERTA